MTIHNSNTRYGSVTRTFHWLIALLILTQIPLGQYATWLADRIAALDAAPDQALVSRTAFLFSLHKTIGVAVFFLALLRILWALGQRKPGLLNGDHRAEALLAETVHWLLYGSLVLVPLTGWVYHAATSGFAPIWWPFGQNLPFVPKNETLSELASTLHYLFQWVLTAAIALHVLGALKHHVIDRDATLRRMLPGQTEGQPTEAQPGHFLPVLGALSVWAAVLLGATYQGWISYPLQDITRESSPNQATSSGDWQVEDGTLSITVVQMGSEVTGHFSDWRADITYDDTSDTAGKRGEVTVTVAIASLELGSVTEQATNPAHLDAAAYPEAVFQADLIMENNQHIARGTLTIKGTSVPVELPFDLTIDDDTAQASGQMQVNRLDFDVGTGTQDEGTLAFGVSIAFDLTATRAD